VRTVARWADVEQFRARKAVPRASKLDAFKGQIVHWLDAHPYSAQQIYQRLAEAGYGGGITIVKDYVHRIRPRQQPAFLKLDFEPGECAQIDDGLDLQAFSAEYIAHILAARRRIGAEPVALQLTRAHDLLELEIPEPDLSIYDRD
jgi:hypothetical protein